MVEVIHSSGIKKHFDSIEPSIEFNELPLMQKIKIVFLRVVEASLILGAFAALKKESSQAIYALPLAAGAALTHYLAEPKEEADPEKLSTVQIIERVSLRILEGSLLLGVAASIHTQSLLSLLAIPLASSAYFLHSYAFPKVLSDKEKYQGGDGDILKLSFTELVENYSIEKLKRYETLSTKHLEKIIFLQEKKEHAEKLLQDKTALYRVRFEEQVRPAKQERDRLLNAIYWDEQRNSYYDYNRQEYVRYYNQSARAEVSRLYADKTESFQQEYAAKIRVEEEMLRNELNRLNEEYTNFLKETPKTSLLPTHTI
jgi:hypothetical protein